MSISVKEAVRIADKLVELSKSSNGPSWEYEFLVIVASGVKYGCEWGDEKIIYKLISE